jgi:hypothetical protein
MSSLRISSNSEQTRRPDPWWNNKNTSDDGNYDNVFYCELYFGGVRCDRGDRLETVHSKHEEIDHSKPTITNF